MRQCESRRARDLFIEPRIVFHCARSERIKASIDRDVQLRQPREVADDVNFRDLDFVRDLAAHQIRGKEIRFLRNVERRKAIAAAAALRVFEDQSFAIRALRHG